MQGGKVWKAVTADTIARMVGMSSGEVADVLGTSDYGSSGADAAGVEAAHTVAELLMQLESTVCSGKCQHNLKPNLLKITTLKGSSRRLPQMQNFFASQYVIL